MIISNKCKLIRMMGQNVTVLDGEFEVESKALISRMTSSSTDSKLLTSFRRGDFPPIKISGGSLVISELDKYLVISIFKEVEYNKVAAIFANLVSFNAFASINRNSETVDEDFGIITKVFENVYEDLEVFLQINNDELKQFYPGYYSNADYTMFISKLTQYPREIKVFDQITAANKNMKVMCVDEHTFPGLVVISAKEDLR